LRPLVACSDAACAAGAGPSGWRICNTPLQRVSRGRQNI
jgi:hypothetical protein